MRIILLSGGSGLRLWPLSNDYRSKQFIKAMDGDGGSGAPGTGPTSMIQRVWAQLSRLGLDKRSILTASRSQEEIIRAQIGGEAPLVLEPGKRDTFPAIGLAAAYLRSAAGADPDEIAVAMPVDVDADADFFAAVARLGEALERSEASLGLLGIKPRGPSEKFGYILTGEEAAPSGDGLLAIRRFVEKPSASEAEALIARGALWNCGIFAFRIGDMLRRLEEGGWPASFDRLLAAYDRMPAISFDYQVVEKETQAVVLPYDGYWNDLGTWNEWTAKMPQALNGNGAIGDDCANTHVINELQIPVVVMGVPNAVVAATPDGVLVASKEASPKLKELVQSVSLRPMYEETLYGWYRIVDVERDANGHQMMTKRVHIWEGKHISYQVHAHRDEIWTLVKGEAIVVIDGRRRDVRAGDVVPIRAGMRHAIRVVRAVDLIEVQIGDRLRDEDIERFDLDWTSLTGRQP